MSVSGGVPHSYTSGLVAADGMVSVKAGNTAAGYRRNPIMRWCRIQAGPAAAGTLTAAVRSYQDLRNERFSDCSPARRVGSPVTGASTESPDIHPVTGQSVTCEDSALELHDSML